MERRSHTGTHTNMTREPTGINGDSRTQLHALTNMIFRRNAHNTTIFHQRLLNRMAHPQRGPCRYGALGEMLIQSTHIHNAGHRRIVVQGNLASRREKDHGRNGMIKMLWNRKGLHITNPTAATGMDRITDLILSLQYQHMHTLLRRRFGSSKARWPTAHN